MKSNRKAGAIFLTGGIVMLTAALLLVGYNLYDDHQAEVATSHVLEALQHEMPTPVPQEPEPSEPPDYVINPDMEIPTIEIENNDYIGVLEIPSLELTLPVMSEWSYAGLKIAPCRYSGSVYTGSMAIAGHNYRSCFGPIGNLSAGAQVIFTDIKGRSFLYEVAATETIKATAIEEIVNAEWDLTLFTCTIGGQARVAVRCGKVQ